MEIKIQVNGKDKQVQAPLGPSHHKGPTNWTLPPSSPPQKKIKMVCTLQFTQRQQEIHVQVEEESKLSVNWDLGIHVGLSFATLTHK